MLFEVLQAEHVIAARVDANLERFGALPDGEPLDLAFGSPSDLSDQTRRLIRGPVGR